MIYIILFVYLIAIVLSIINIKMLRSEIEEMNFELGMQDDAINMLFEEVFPDDICDECIDAEMADAILRQPTKTIKKNLTKKK